MINYNLAKKLKKAGFPHTGESEWWFLDGKKDVKCDDIWNDEEIYIPELSELIKACGEDFSHLAQKVDYPKIGRWWAVTHTKHDKNGNNYEECGRTPEEAVARLWLSLNNV
jgi:hypothetical protein